MTPSPGPEAAITLDRVTKEYHIQQRASPRLGAWVVNKLFEHFRRVPFHALEDVTFSVPRGQMVGFLGSNGAGKSTTLKLIAGITQPTSGTVRVRGRVASMLELGVGFHPDLSGMENIFLNASMLGLRRDETLARLGAIIAFSGLEPFIYEPVKHYSSGMYARLACSVAMHVDPDIVLVDEILAVGDADFQHRAMMRLLQMHESGATILLVTHAVAPARNLCSRLIWLDQGRVQADGPSAEIADRYYAFQNERSIPVGHFLRPSGDPPGARPPSAPRLASCRVVDDAGRSLDLVQTGQSVRIEFEVESQAGHAAPWRLAFAILWDDHRVMFEDSVSGDGAIPARLVYEVPRWPLLRQRMALSAALVDPATGDLLDQRLRWVAFRTESPPEHLLPSVAMELHAAWQVERVG